MHVNLDSQSIDPLHHVSLSEYLFTVLMVIVLCFSFDQRVLSLNHYWIKVSRVLELDDFDDYLIPSTKHQKLAGPSRVSDHSPPPLPTGRH